MPIRRRISCTQPLQKQSSLNSKIEANASRTLTLKQRAKRRLHAAHWQGGNAAAVEAMAAVSMAAPLQDLPGRVATAGPAPRTLLGCPLSFRSGRWLSAQYDTPTQFDCAILRASVPTVIEKSAVHDKARLETFNMSPDGIIQPEYSAHDRSAQVARAMLQSRGVCVCLWVEFSRQSERY